LQASLPILQVFWQSWDEYFRAVQAGRSSSEFRIAPFAHRVAPSGGTGAIIPTVPVAAHDTSLAPLSQQHLIDTLSVQLIIRSF
uniref:Uncharacterized protein n=1 Tax=Romanomermis culicivorax TaxID=13658 RepID=A0A915JC03_ROMCU